MCLSRNKQRKSRTATVTCNTNESKISRGVVDFCIKKYQGNEFRSPSVQPFSKNLHYYQENKFIHGISSTAK